MGNGVIPLHCRNNHVCGNVGSEKLFRQSCTRVQYPIWLCGRVHIYVNVLRRVAGTFAVHSAINVIIWPFSILSLIPNVGVGYCINNTVVNVILFTRRKCICVPCLMSVSSCMPAAPDSLHLEDSSGHRCKYTLI